MDKPKSKYKGVSIIKDRSKKCFIYVGKVCHKCRQYSIFDNNERKCAFRLDMKRIELGLEPVNILKRA